MKHVHHPGTMILNRDGTFYWRGAETVNYPKGSATVTLFRAEIQSIDNVKMPDGSRQKIYWMDYPEIGIEIPEIIFVRIGKKYHHGSFTFLPDDVLFTFMPAPDNAKVIAARNYLSEISGDE